jgi:hypothetical protein
MIFYQFFLIPFEKGNFDSFLDTGLEITELYERVLNCHLKLKSKITIIEKYPNFNPTILKYRFSSQYLNLKHSIKTNRKKIGSGKPQSGKRIKESNNFRFMASFLLIISTFCSHFTVVGFFN